MGVWEGEEWEVRFLVEKKKKKEVCSAVRVGFQQHFASARQAKSSLGTKTDSMKGKQVYSRHNGATHQIRQFYPTCNTTIL